MVGANPKFQIVGCAKSGGVPGHAAPCPAPSMALGGDGCTVRAAIPRSRSMRQGARRRNAGGEHAKAQNPRPARRRLRPIRSRTVSPSRNSPIVSRPPMKACPRSAPGRAGPAAAHGAYRARAGRIADAHAEPAPSHRARGADHTGQHEIVSLPLFRHQPALRRAVPQHLQGRPQGTSQLRRPGLLAGRDLQRQPRAGACPRDVRRPQAGRDRGVLPRQRRDAGARRPRPATGAAADFGFRRQCRAARAPARGERRRFQRRQVLAAGRLQALHR